MTDDEFRDLLVRNRPRAIYLAVLLLTLIAWLNVPGRPDL